MRPFTFRRSMRRLGTLLLVPVVLGIMLVEWLSAKAFAVFHSLVVFLRLKRVEDLQKAVKEEQAASEALRQLARQIQEIGRPR